MKAFNLTWMVVILATLSGRAQTTPAANNNVPPDTAYTVVDQGANHNVWEKTSYELAPDGTLHAKTHRYTELASGLNYWNNGQWTPAQEQIEPFSGGAVAQQGQYQVIFANNLNSQGSIDCQTVDGKRLRSNILSLEYYDPTTGQSALIGQVQNSQGEIISANQVLYQNAFSGVNADVRYTYNKSGFEQEVILRAQLPAPEAFGLSSASSELAVCTEFIDPPTVEIRNIDSGEQLSNGLEPDQGISWGVTTLSRGHAFDLGDQGQVPVTKEYVTIQGRQILIEKVRLNQIRGYLSSLPEQASVSRKPPLIACQTLLLPNTPLAQKTGKPLKYAKAPPARGFVMDYISLTSGYTNYTFQGDTTYYLSGNLTLKGTNYFEGGTVIKFASGTSITESAGPFTPDVVFESTPYRPVVFTAKDDNTCGQPISGSSGSPSGYYASPALYLPGGGIQQVSDFKIAYANPALNAPSTSLTLYDGQIYKCGAGVALAGDPALVENVLFSSVRTNFVLSAGAAVSAQQVTFDNSVALTSPTNSFPTGASLALTNCVLVNVTNLSATVAAGYNGFYQTAEIGSSHTTNSGNPFQSALGGGCYLTNGCAFHNAGTPAINPTLWINLAAKTTYAPIVYSNATFTVVTNFYPQAQRDTNAAPDLGYHYSPLDYIFGGVNAYTNLTFAADTAVGWYNGGPWSGSSEGYGIALENSSQAAFNGMATAPCIFAKTTMVQEGDTGYWTPEGYLGGFIGLGGHNTQATAPTLILNFTRCYARDTETAIFRDYGDGTLLVTKANNSEFYCGEAAGYLMYFYFTNCLSFRTILGPACACSSSVTMRNCTFFGGQLTADRESATWPLVVEDCAFAGVNFNYLNDTSGGDTNITWINYNSFLTTDSLPSGQGSHYLTLASYSWQSSWFGNFYLPPGSSLIQAGSTTANNIGLFHFTTQTNQMPETNAVVDIGYHYVAADEYGNPLDSNGDGIPDYLEDANGNGLDDPGEIPWDVAILSQPASLTVVSGSNATFSVTAGGSLPLGYHWKLGTTYIPGASANTYTITNVSPANAGTYSVAVTSATGCTLNSSNASLSVTPWVPSYRPTNGLVGWWRGEDNGMDSFGGHDALVMDDISYTPGVLGQAFHCDPAIGTPRILISDCADFQLTNSLTIEGWVRPHGPGYVVFWRGDDRAGLDPYTLSMQNNNTILFSICNASNDTVSVQTPIPYNNWTYVAAVLDGSAGTITLYTNGVVAAATTTIVRPFAQLEPLDDPGVCIGNVGEGGDNFPMYGDIDEIALYSRALSQAEITNIYQGYGTPPVTADIPTISRMNALQLPASSSFAFGFPTLFTNSDALDPQGLPLTFKVDSVVNGSLTINGSPFSSVNNSIAAGASAVWTPSPLWVGTNTTAFQVYISNGANRSTNAVDVTVSYTPQNYLMGWGANCEDFLDADGLLGIGTMDTEVSSSVPLSIFINGNVPLYQDDSSLGIATPIYPDLVTTFDAPVSESDGLMINVAGRPPQPILNVTNVVSVSILGDLNGYFDCAITQDKHLWIWGVGGSYLAGRPEIDEYTNRYWGGADFLTNAPWHAGFPPTAGFEANGINIEVSILATLSPVEVLDPQTQQPMAGVVAAEGNLILKDDGSLWSYGLGGTLMGYDISGDSITGDPYMFYPEDDYEAYGMVPEQVNFPGNGTAGITDGRQVVEINTSGFEQSLQVTNDFGSVQWDGVGNSLIRCRDGSLWTWGMMLDGVNVQDYTFTYQLGDPSLPIWQPQELTGIESALSGSPVKQISQMFNHIIILQTNGDVSELGYIPELDPVRGTVEGIHGAAPTDDFAGEEFTNCYVNSPLFLASLTNVSQVSAGPDFGSALTANGQVYVWGVWWDQFFTTPQLIPSLTNIVKIATGVHFIMALDNDGHVWGVGINDDDVFGSGDSSLLLTNSVFYSNAVEVQGVENAVDLFSPYLNNEVGGHSQVYVIGTTVQNKPTYVVATALNQSVQLNWSNYPSATSYIILRSTSSTLGYSPVGSSTGNSYVDESPPLVNGQTYFYEVTAVVNGVETAPSWSVSATPFPAPTNVMGASAEWYCNGSLLQWDPPANAAASPVQSYVILRDNVPLAELAGDVTNYCDDSPIGGSTYTYAIEARNTAGQSSTNVTLNSSSHTIACAPAPLVATNDDNYVPWLGVKTNDPGSDLVTLVWSGAVTNSGPDVWSFQPYEFETVSSDLGDFIDLLQDNNCDTNYVKGWLWAQFTAGESNILNNAGLPVSTQLSTNIAALNRILSNGQSISNNSLFVTAVQTGYFTPEGFPLRPETINLFNTYPTGTNLIQLKRMLLDDYFMGFTPHGYFTRAPNWGSLMTGFRLHYNLVQYVDGAKLAQDFQQDINLNSLTQTYGTEARYDDDSGLMLDLYKFTWLIPHGAAVSASVSALVAGQESDLSTQLGPVTSTIFYQYAWDPALRGIPGYQQVYLDWADSIEISSYDVLCSTNATDAGQCDSTLDATNWKYVASGLEMNCFWETNVSPGTYYYKVVAHFIDGTTNESCSVSGTPLTITNTSTTAPPGNKFSASATPYDGMVLVNWSVPTNSATPPFDPLTQTNWQFYVERKAYGGADSTYQTIMEPGYGLTFLDANVADDQSYTYRVSAFDANFDRLQTNAVTLSGGSTQITPTPTNGLTLLPPTPGNGYVDLAWSPILATEFTVESSLSPQGPFNVIGNTYPASAFQNAANTYPGAPAQNGVTNYFQVVATTPGGFQISSGIQGAVPRATLGPPQPNDFLGWFLPNSTSGDILLSWKGRGAPASYQVYLREGAGLVPIYSGSGTFCLFPVPDPVPNDETNNGVFTFEARAVSAAGNPSAFDETTVRYKPPGSPITDVTAPLLLQVGGSYGPSTNTGPTNLVLNAVCQLSDITSVAFFADGQPIGVVSSPPFQMTWFNAPGGTHSMTASAVATDIADNINTIDSDPNVVTINVTPTFATYQTSATDLQLPAPGLPISLSRSYNSQSTNTAGLLAMGWAANWQMGTLSLSADLSSGWTGVSQSDGYDGDQYYLGDSAGHSVTVSLPNGQSASFAPQFSATAGSDVYPFVPAGSYADGTPLAINFTAYDPSEGSLTCGGLTNLEAGCTNFDIWDGLAISFAAGSTNDVYTNTFSASPTNFVYTNTDGTCYLFGLQEGTNLTWLLTQTMDRNSNTLTYAYNSDFTLQSINNSCGRAITFGYSSPHNGTTNISVYDPDSGTGGPPVLVYVLVTNQLTQVQKLINRSTSSYETTTYLYGTNASGDPNDLNLLTDAYDPRGVRLVHNAYTNGADGSIGHVMVQIIDNYTNTFALDASNDVTVTTSTSTSSSTVEVTSEASGAIAGVTQPTSGTSASTVMAAQNTYNNQGLVASQTDANGNVKSYSYNAQGRLTSQSDGAGNTTSQTLNAYGEPLGTTNANGSVNSYGYDANGNPLVETDPAGTVTTYAYTNYGLVAAEYQAGPFMAYSNATLYTYTPSGDEASETQGSVDNGGNFIGTPVTTAYACDANGNQTSVTKTRTVNGGLQTIVTANLYDAQNRLVSATTSASGTQTLAAQTTTTTYNLLDKEATNTDAAGHGTVSVYDYNGNQIETDYPDGTVSRTVYDAMNRSLYVQDRAVTNGSGISMAPATRNTYDASSRVIRVDRLASLTLQLATATAGSDYGVINSPAVQSKLVASVPGDQVATNILTTTLTFYDAVGNVQYSVSPRGLVTQSQYNADGQLTNEVVFPDDCYWNDFTVVTNTPHPTGVAQNTGYTYDPDGNQTTVTDANGHTTTSTYDASDRVIEVDMPAAGGGLVSTFTYYDGLGRKIQQTDEAGVNTTYSYDFRGLLTSVTLASGTSQQATTTYQYDEAGNEINQTDANGNTTTFLYDALGHRLGRTLPAGQSEGFAYDLEGNPLYQTNFNGVIITNQYDWGNRLTSQASVNGYHVSYAFNPTGVRTNMVDMSGVTAYFYDTMSRLTNKAVSWTNGPTLAVNYAYSTNGSVTALWSGSASGVTNAYQYDLLGRLTNVLANGNAAAGYGYDLVGNLQSLKYGNGVTNWYQYDPQNRLTNLVWKAGGTLVANFAYTLGPTGNRLALTETNDGTIRSYSWAYDSLYRLTQETLSGGTSGTLTYGYDPVGNRTSRTSSPTLPNQANTFTANDWLASDNYDNNGNTTNSAGNFYRYDALNRLTNVNNGAILVAYDGDGNRVRKTISGTTTYYLVDDLNPSGYAQVLEEWTASGGSTNLSRLYNYGTSLISQRQVAGGASTNYFVWDGHGSTRMLMDIGGNVANAFAYDAYGTLIASNTASQTAYLYSGQQFDSDLGSYYQRARYLNQNTGRFWTMDTYQGDNEEPISLHKYLYCEANPVNENDPSGNYGSGESSSDIESQLLQQVGLLSGVPHGNWHKVIFKNNTPDAWVDVYYQFAFVSSDVEEAVVDRYVREFKAGSVETFIPDETSHGGGRWFADTLTAHAEPDSPEGIGVRFFGRLRATYDFKWKLRCTKGLDNGKILSQYEKALSASAHPIGGAITYSWVNDDD
jgi:RHS repeat-associated protein